MSTDDMKNNPKWLAWYEKYKDTIADLRAEQEKLRKSIKQKVCSSCNTKLSIRQFKKKKRTRKDGTSYTSYANICKACSRKEAKLYRDSNTDKIKEYRKRPDVKAKNSMHSRTREMRLMKAQPKWLTKDDKKAMQDVYDHMRDCRAATGEEYHVDHIIPIKGKNVCGLHVPWNLQVLPSDVNIAKSNSIA